MYADVEKQREANREKAKRHRERVKGVTEGVTEVVEKVTTEPKGVTRINPRTGRAYGPSMLGLLSYPKGAECLKEYEKRYNQTEPVYGPGNKYDFLAEYGTSEKFKRIVSSLGDLSGEVRIGAFGPTIQELADTLS